MTTMTETYESNVTGEIIKAPVEVPRTDDDLQEFFRLHEDLGLEVPSEDAVTAWEHAHAMGTEAKQVRGEESLTLGALARELGRGRITVKEAEKKFSAVLTTSASEYQDARVRMYLGARKESIRVCRGALREAGDQLLAGPRSVLLQAIEDAQHVDAQARYDSAIRLTILALGFGIPKAEGATLTEYLYARPDLVTDWTKVSGRLPNVQDIAAHPEWKPGLLTASEVVEAQGSKAKAAA